MAGRSSGFHAEFSPSRKGGAVPKEHQVVNSIESGKYPLLEAVLAVQGCQLQGIYTLKQVTEIFQVSTRSIQQWIFDGKLAARDLPGNGRFLSLDLERFLESSLRTVRMADNQSVSAAGGRRPRHVLRKHLKERREAE